MRTSCHAVMKAYLVLVTVSRCPLKNYHLTPSHHHTYQTGAKRQSGILWAIKGTSDLSEGPEM
jgi:hypothetical protein